MALPRTFPLRRTTVCNASASDVFFPATPWMDAGKPIEGRCLWMEMIGESGAVQVMPAWQTCNDRRTPDAAVGLATSQGYATADGTYDPPASWSAMTAVAGKAEIRFGFIIKTGGAFGGCSVAAKVQVNY